VTLPVGFVVEVLPGGYVRVACPYRRGSRHIHLLRIEGDVHGYVRQGPCCGPYMVQFRPEHPEHPARRR
jgi:hypothetical protein